MNESKKNLGKQFVPSSGEKKLSGLGSYYGSLSGPIEALSPATNPASAYKAPKKNLYTNPGKKGTGYGYASVTFSRYGEHAPEKYDQYREQYKEDAQAHGRAMKGGAFRLNMAPRAYFDENPYKSDKTFPAIDESSRQSSAGKPFKPSSPSKKDGGMKAGTFDPYPTHSADDYKILSMKRSSSGKALNKVFIPPAGIKSAPVNSVLHQNISRSVNVQNYKTVQTVMVY